MKKNFSPTIKLKDLDETYISYVDQLIRKDDKTATEWFEKFRRFTSLYGRKLKYVSKKRFGSNYKVILDWMINWLFYATELDSNKNDHSYLNAILFCNDALDHAYDKKIDKKIYEHEMFIKKIDNPKIIHSYGEEIQFNKKLFVSNTKSVAIFAPSPFTHFGLIVFDQLLKLNLKPSLVIVKKFTLNRFISELKRDGFRIILKKIWRKLILKKNENYSPESFGTVELLNNLEINERNLKKLSRKNNIKYLAVDDFSDINDVIKLMNIDYGIFTGGGMIKNTTIECFKKGIINTHMGPLPTYRGMDVVQAPILDGNLCNISLTTHFMNNELDKGDVLSKMTFDSRSYNDLESLRNELSVSQPVLALYSLLMHMDGKLIPKEQNLSKGKQYYFIHSKLQKILKEIMINFSKTKIIKRDIESLFSKILIK